MMDSLKEFFKSLLVWSLVRVVQSVIQVPKLNLVSGLHMLDNSSVKQVGYARDYYYVVFTVHHMPIPLFGETSRGL